MAADLRQQGYEPCLVKSYSGHTYAQRPEAFLWRRRWHQVKRVELEWREPDLRRFIVLTDDGAEFDLGYDEPQDIWWIREFAGL